MRAANGSGAAMAGTVRDEMIRVTLARRVSRASTDKMLLAIKLETTIRDTHGPAIF
jgi:hypothetical protein